MIMAAVLFGSAGLCAQVSAQTVEKFKSLKIGGVRMISFEDQKNSVRPFNWTPGYTLSIVGEIPAPAMSVKSGTLEKAIADNGQDLLPGKSWDKRISFPRLSKDKKFIIFEVKLKVPAVEVRGLKEVTGSLEYLTSMGTKTIDAGKLVLKKGSKGSALGAEIIDVKPSKNYKGEHEVRLKLITDRASIKEVQFLGADGKPIAVKSGSSSWTPTWVWMDYRFKSPLPASIKLRIVQYDKLKTHKLRFTISNVTLMGRPVKK